MQNFRGYERAAVRAINQLLTTYRSVNIEHRTSSAPLHFKRPWDLPYSIVETAEVKNLLPEGSLPQPSIDEVLSKLQQHSSQVLMEYEALIQKFPHAI